MIAKLPESGVLCGNSTVFVVVENHLSNMGILLAKEDHIMHTSGIKVTLPCPNF